MSEPPPRVVLLAKLRAPTSGTAGARSTGRSKNGDVRYRLFFVVNVALVPGLITSRSNARIRLAIGSLTKTVRTGTQLKSTPTRVTTFGSVELAVSVLMFEIGVNEPVSASASTPFAT